MREFAYEAALPTVGDRAEPERDLWPAMLRGSMSKACGAGPGPHSLVRLGAGWRAGGVCCGGSAHHSGDSLLPVTGSRKRSAESEVVMNTHPYLRAFLAGAFVPTRLMPATLTALCDEADFFRCRFPDRARARFSVALVPFLWAVWNPNQSMFQTAHRNGTSANGKTSPRSIGKIRIFKNQLRHKKYSQHRRHQQGRHKRPGKKCA